MSAHKNRRQFLKASAAAGVGYWVAGGVSRAVSKSPNEQIQLAGIGVEGKGKSDIKHASSGAKIYAICDVDRAFLPLAGVVYDVEPERQFTDYRELFDKLGDQIDACTISIPDHCHAVVAAQAMKAGKHIYCQKPLTHSIWEARMLQNIARESGVQTQMGNQFTSYNPARRAAAQIQAGQVGTVQEVHIWTNRPVWPQGKPRGPEKPVPATLDWNAWIGPAPMRPYADGYHQFEWRGWWDFGTGALGDMACHTCNFPFMALNMRDPYRIEAVTTGHNGDSYPSRSKIRFDFPEQDGRAAFPLHWYDGSNVPPQELFDDFQLTVERNGNQLKPYVSGVLIIGDEGKLYAAGDYADEGIEIVGKDEIDVDYSRAFMAGKPDEVHMAEFINAIRYSDQPSKSNIVDMAGPLTETILLGNLAVAKATQPDKPAIVDWDAKKLQAKNDPQLAAIVKPSYREGYVI